MATNRIQKLLFSEYSDFEDIVLVESPFAETSRHGKGIRQVQIGLTPTKLILASYHVESLDGDEDKQRNQKAHDPDIESFELVSAYPVECVNLSVFRHRSRQTLKARFCNGKVLYFEIGGWQERKMLWSAWCERIKFLSPYESGTSVSETSVASSSSSSCSLYIARSSLSVSKTGRPTLWCHYAVSSTGDDAKMNIPSSWDDPHLFLGPQFFEKGINFMSLPEIKKRMTVSSKKKEDQSKRPSKRKSRFELSERHERTAREAVELWESQKGMMGRKIHRRYGLTPYPHLLAGMGLTTLSRAHTFSIQGRRSVSEVRLAVSCDGVDYQLTLARSQLIRTVSQESLDVPAICPDKLLRLSQNQSRHPLKFWTTINQQNLNWSLKQYKIQQRHLRTLRKSSSCHIPGLKQKKRRKKKLRSNLTQKITTREEGGFQRHPGGGDSLTAPTSLSCPCLSLGPRQSGATTDGQMDKLPSSSIAHQLTMIDKQLILQITSIELGRMRRGMNSCRAPHLRALVSFSRRISCLVASQVLNGASVRDRAVLIVKYVGVAFKCHTLHSLQSAESVLRGLQSPAVYRLRHSWAYVRKHYASKYRRFEDLSRRYQDPRLLLYQRTFDNQSRTPPFLPSASLLVAVLLKDLPDLPKVRSSKYSTECSEACKFGSTIALADSLPKSVRKFLSALTVYPSSVFRSKLDHPRPSSCQSETHLHAVSNETILENLDKFFSPVSDPGERRVLQDAEFFLETCQAAALRYAIPTSPRVRDFLLKYPYQEMEDLFKVSMQLESRRVSE